MLYYYRRQLKAAAVVAVVAIAVYGGLKLAMHYQVERALQDLETALAGRAQLSYGAIETDLRGEAKVHDLSVLPAGAPQPIKVDLARMTGPHVGYFLMEQDKRPPQLKLELLGVHVPLDPAMFSAMKDQLAETATSAAADGDGCGTNDGLSPALLNTLGMTELVMDMSTSYRMDEDRRQLAADVALDLEGIENIQGSITLGDVSPRILEGDSVQMDTLPTLVDLNLGVRVEPAFAEQYVSACAQKRGQSEDDFRKHLVDEAKSGMAGAGLHLGPGLADALNTFHHQWGNVSLAMHPAEPVNLLALLLGKATDWQRMLGLELALNGAPVTDLRFELRPPDAGELAVLMGEKPPKPKPKPRDRYRYVYRTVPVTALNQHIGTDVRVQLRDQPPRSGTLTGIVANEARVEQRLHGGKITAHVPLADIVSVEVRKVEKIPSKDG